MFRQLHYALCHTNFSAERHNFYSSQSHFWFLSCSWRLFLFSQPDDWLKNLSWSISLQYLEQNRGFLVFGSNFLSLRSCKYFLCWWMASITDVFKSNLSLSLRSLYQKILVNIGHCKFLITYIPSIIHVW